MASATTINSWLEELAGSILPTSQNRSERRRSLEVFRRRVRSRAFGRTNQFEVKERLEGLEEKFQIVNRDDLSDALFKRRVELQEHEQQWIPDVLDLLLRLSNDPVARTRLLDIDEIQQSAFFPSATLWSSDDDVDGAIDQDDPIWKVPVYSDLSSDEDEVEISTATTTSPNSVKRSDIPEQDLNERFARAFDGRGATGLPQDLGSVPREKISEILIVRETLLMVQGYPTTIYIADRRKHLTLKYGIKMKEIDAQNLQTLVDRAIMVRRQIELVRSWTEKSTNVDYVQAIQEGLIAMLSTYTSFISQLTQILIEPASQVAVSLLHVIDQLEAEAKVFEAAVKLVQKAKLSDPVMCISYLFDVISECYFCNDEVGYLALLPTFIRAFGIYLKPIKIWLNQGRIDEDSHPYFIVTKSQTSTMSNLWHDWYGIEEEGPQRPPDFLQQCARDIFACGKTSTFIRHITHSQSVEQEDLELETLIDEVREAALNTVIPFPAAFHATVCTCVSNLLDRKTAVLKALLDTRCGFSRSLDALDQIYLRRNGVAIDNIESKIFGYMDRCLEKWNDRFMLAEMFEDTYSDIVSIDLNAIIVHSVRTSSRTMESRRRSVKIMAALAFEYVLPWPIANILPKETTAAYCRIALHLSQIRRAKFVLERVAYTSVNSDPVSNDPTDQKKAQILTFMLLNFVNNLYDHFTSSVIGPLTFKMRRDLLTAQTVDGMISIHHAYITAVEIACLTIHNLRMLRETLIGLLDMCIRFSDLVTSPAAAAAAAITVRRDSDDFEASSFKSARSLVKPRYRRRKPHQGKARTQPSGGLPFSGEDNHQDDDDDDRDESDSDEEEEDDDENEEGYSSFIVLDEGTSIPREIQKLQLQFRRQLDFFVAGLRGIGRSSTGTVKANERGSQHGDAGVGGKSSSTMEEMNLLADRLSWKIGR